MWEGAHVTLLQHKYGRALGFGEYDAGRKYAALAEMYRYPVADESKGAISTYLKHTNTVPGRADSRTEIVFGDSRLYDCNISGPQLGMH
jgi:hypothetical protein